MREEAPQIRRTARGDRQEARHRPESGLPRARIDRGVTACTIVVGPELTSDQKRDLERLISGGYAGADGEPGQVGLHAHSQGRRVSWQVRRRVG